MHVAPWAAVVEVEWEDSHDKAGHDPLAASPCQQPCELVCAEHKCLQSKVGNTMGDDQNRFARILDGFVASPTGQDSHADPLWKDVAFVTSSLTGVARS